MCVRFRNRQITNKTPPNEIFGSTFKVQILEYFSESLCSKLQSFMSTNTGAIITDCKCFIAPEMRETNFSQQICVVFQTAAVQHEGDIMRHPSNTVLMRACSLSFSQKRKSHELRSESKAFSLQAIDQMSSN